MRSYNKEDEYDKKELARLNVEPWAVEQLRLNPSYVSWGPGEDYMPSPDKSKQSWGASLEFATWAEFSGEGSESGNFSQLDELNECVNFYFSLQRSSKECACGGCGYNQATQVISESFYNHSSPTGKGWNDAITQDEVDALVDAGRLSEWDKTAKCWTRPKIHPSAEEINSIQGGPFHDAKARFHSHDAINRGILIEARAKRLGVWGLCETCEGHGYEYTEPTGHLQLTLWMLHPRKGASRGVEIKDIQKKDLPAVIRFLQSAAKRNADRFSKVM